MTLLPERRADDLLEVGRRVVDAQALEVAAAIVEDVRERGEAAVMEHARRLGDLGGGEAVWWDRSALAAALGGLPREQRELLERTAGRIRAFAEDQRAALAPMERRVAGVTCGHEIAPVQRAGCYAPGGRFPLPSSVLMTAVTARAAGVTEVWVASPRPTPVTRAAAAIAGADGLLAVGGAQAVAALAFGCGPMAACDVVVGPGNRFVTAAKKLLAGEVGIDMLAGPSELVVLADAGADCGRIAADLLAQAEHDPDARPILVALDGGTIAAVRGAAERQLADLPTAATARAALVSGFAVRCADLGAAAAVIDRLAPEHLALHVEDAEGVRGALHHYGALFLGGDCAEVLGDYGVGPNHVLPTGGGARHAGGLSVFTFLRVRTWMRCDDPAAMAPLLADTAALARLEGLEAHARSATTRE